MCDDEAGVGLSVLDALQQRSHVALHVGLPGLNRQRAIHDRASISVEMSAQGHSITSHAIVAGERAGGTRRPEHIKMPRLARGSGEVWWRGQVRQLTKR